MSGELYNSSQLAKLTGVADSTITLWVKNGTVVPVTKQNNRPMFNDETRLGILRRFAKDYAKQSFLGVIVETSKETIESEKAKFYSAVHLAMPSCRSIVSLDEAILGMMNGDPISVSEDFERVFSTQVVSKFEEAWREYVYEMAVKIFSRVAGSEDLPFSFVRDLLIGNSANPELLSKYRGLEFTDISLTVDGIKQSSLAVFDAYCRRYGLYVSVMEKGCTRADVFFGRASSMLAGCIALHDDLASSAKKLYESMTNTVTAKSVRSGIQQLFSDGYCSCVEGVDSLDTDSEAFVFKAITSGDYSVVYVSSLTNLSPVMRQTLQGLASARQIDLIVADSVSA